MRSRKKKVIGGVLILLITALVTLRLALPTIVQHYVNNKLDELPEYDGRIGDVDIHLIRGAYSIDDVDIEKTTGSVPMPFFSARTVDLSMEWREIFQGALVGEIQVLGCSLNFVKGENEEDSQTSIDNSWLKIVQDLFPFRINRFTIREGAIWFHDLGTEPKVDVYLTNLVAVCTNLYNTRDLATELPADFRARGTTLGGGLLELHVKLDPLADEPMFDLELGLTEVNLVALNEMLEAYGRFNVKRGTFEAFAEIAGSEGTFDGYVKPFFEDLNVFELEQDAKNPAKLIWQAIVAGAVKVFKNHPQDQVATKVPVSGTFEKTDIEIWTTIVNVLRNAFFEAFKARVDDSINLFERDEEAKRKAD
ncbi:MAG TPA: DUF748 domain-containing protein [Candidatus Kapabacteria bacterium]|nr:DUF748 domain-containing protein [Candidatus Kapabacteria bacterium]